MARQQLILDRYLVVGHAGAGGFATVQHAYDTHLKRDVAIKCITLSEADVARAHLLAMEERLQREDGSLTGDGSAHVGSEHVAFGDAVERQAEWRAEQRPERQAEQQAERRAQQTSGASAPKAMREPLPWEDDPAEADEDELNEYEDWLDFDDEDPEQCSLPVMSADDASRTAFMPAFPRDPAFLDKRSKHAVPPPASSSSAAAKPAAVEHTAAPAAKPAAVEHAAAPAVKPAAAPALSEALDDDLSDDDLFDHIPGLAEAQTVAKLNDSNIVTVYDCAVSGNVAYIIMEYVEGKTLAQIMHEVGDDISLDAIASVFTSVAHALEVAHDADVLHLDIKPENVIVNKKGVVKVTDFGLATLMDASGRGKTGGGTIGYMPLEQMRQEPLDVRTDEWALASLAYEMLSGTNPFRARTLEAAEEAIEEAELVLPSLCWDALDAAADDVVFTALDPDPDERYESVAAFAEELTPFLGSTRSGKRALAAIVNGEEPAPTPEPAAPREPAPPLIDRVGPVGASVITRVLAVASSVMVGAVALVNVRIDPSAMMGLASDNAVVFWIALTALAVLSAFRPTWGVLAAYMAFSAMLISNFAFAPGLLLLVAAGVWWWFVGRRSEGAAVSALLQPLCGAVGFSAVAPIAAGALLGVREAAATAVFAAVSALAFASLGSCDLAGWDIGAHALTSASREIAGPQITDAFLATALAPATWCIAASWVLAAALFALFCHKGTRAFDIAGACVAAVVLLAGVLCGAFAADALGVGSTSIGAATPDATSAGSLDAMAVLGVLAPGMLGIVLAVMSLCDRVRLAEGEW